MAKEKGGAGALGRWAFLLGVVLAVVFGFFSAGAWLIWLLVVLGLVIGLLNIEKAEVSAFLTAGTILALMGFLGGQALGSIIYLGAIFSNLLTLFVPATIVVALKSVFGLASS